MQMHSMQVMQQEPCAESMLPHLLYSKDRAAPLLTITIRLDKLL